MDPNVQTSSRSYFASTVATFLATPAAHVGSLSTRIGREHRGDEAQQIRSWERQIAILKDALKVLADDTGGILLELPLLRLGRRIDTVLLMGDIVVPIEFKIGATRYASADVEQAVDYALCLRDFHAASHGRTIIPVLCADEAPPAAVPSSLTFVENVAECLSANGETLLKILEAITQHIGGEQIDWRTFDAASYNPTPSIVASARSLYAGHTVRDIGRSDANSESLEATASKLREIAQHTRDRREHAICFVTGEPGSGKTLLGLDLAFTGHAGRVAGEPAAQRQPPARVCPSRGHRDRCA